MATGVLFDAVYARARRGLQAEGQAAVFYDVLSTAILRKNLVHFGWPQFVISEQALQTLLLRVG